MKLSIIPIVSSVLLLSYAANAKTLTCAFVDESVKPSGPPAEVLMAQSDEAGIAKLSREGKDYKIAVEVKSGSLIKVMMEFTNQVTLLSDGNESTSLTFRGKNRFISTLCTVEEK